MEIECHLVSRLPQVLLLRCVHAVSLLVHHVHNMLYLLAGIDERTAELQQQKLAIISMDVCAPLNLSGIEDISSTCSQRLAFGLCLVNLDGAR